MPWTAVWNQITLTIFAQLFVYSMHAWNLPYNWNEHHKSFTNKQTNKSWKQSTIRHARHIHTNHKITDHPHVGQRGHKITDRPHVCQRVTIILTQIFDCRQVIVSYDIAPWTKYHKSSMYRTLIPYAGRTWSGNNNILTLKRLCKKKILASVTVSIRRMDKN